MRQGQLLSLTRSRRRLRAELTAVGAAVQVAQKAVAGGMRRWMSQPLPQPDRRLTTHCAEVCRAVPSIQGTKMTNDISLIPRTPSLTDLVAQICGVVGRALPDQQTADAVGRVLRPALSLPDLLRPEQRKGNPDHYTQHVLHVAADGSFSVVALVWLPGQSTAIHDHVSWCTVGVYGGVESEIRYRVSDPPSGRQVVETDRCLNPAGSISAIAPPGDIHQVLNCGDSTAISLHVYGADIAKLGSSIRRIY